MAEYHPLSDELVKSWIHEANHNEPMFPQVARFGADWQLDQVIDFLEANKDLSIETLLPLIRLHFKDGNLQKDPSSFKRDIQKDPLAEWSKDAQKYYKSPND